MGIGKGHRAGGIRDNAPDLEFSYLRYGKHNLHRIGVWEQRRPANPNAVYWLIFIHGGAWRDPRNKPTDFAPSIRHLMTAGNLPETVRGFMSIDYRLSPYQEEFPQCVDETPSSEQRIAQHPDHVHDVRSAMDFLSQRFDLGNKYIMIGHSAGAMLAFQLLMSSAQWQLPSSVPLPKPAAIIGVSGIYDLVNLNRRYDGNYASFISNAFGEDEDVWARASPAQYCNSFEQPLLSRGTPLWLAISPTDGLLDLAETEAMAEKLRVDGFQPTVVNDLHGEHDFVWQDGAQVAGLVRRVLDELRLQ
ncbi:hypothetical protein CCM_05607 [Cordyceps militaris CM01]|uniref:Kynurenine formamidase n=1 Tax=Cordyceps militaris (strain CM01) TaxID=983644 RepID=G3JKL0_CORMM|nr:uncharacterized protein CCM_05607 [Cordyceps militaris CM01]EGX91449.1 hypothetical protein CCM_05607 [Cordyceps militaris CM01]